MAIVSVSITPIGTGTPSVGDYVAACHEALRQETGVRYQLTPMATILEGDLDRLFQVVRKMQEAAFDKGAVRLSTVIKIDDRRDKHASMEDKVDTVNRRLRSGADRSDIDGE